MLHYVPETFKALVSFVARLKYRLKIRFLKLAATPRFTDTDKRKRVCTCCLNILLILCGAALLATGESSLHCWKQQFTWPALSFFFAFAVNCCSNCYLFWAVSVIQNQALFSYKSQSGIQRTFSPLSLLHSGANRKKLRIVFCSLVSSGSCFTGYLLCHCSGLPWAVFC